MDAPCIPHAPSPTLPIPHSPLLWHFIICVGQFDVWSTWVDYTLESTIQVMLLLHCDFLLAM